MVEASPAGPVHSGVQMRDEPDGVLALPGTRQPVCSVLLLSGSSGRIERERAELLARQGAAVMAVRWFGGVGQPPGICEVPLESFSPALDRLYNLHPRLVVMGSSKGAEAALLLAAQDARIQLTVAMSPSSVVWANLGAGLDGHDRPYRSCWTVGGHGLPFVPYDDDWSWPSGAPEPAFVGHYEQSLERFPAEALAAAIRSEAITGRVVLTAGGDDQVWPSLRFARDLAHRRALVGMTTTVLAHPDAGHRLQLPGEQPVTGGVAMRRGGTPEADAELGTQVWSALMADFHAEA